MRKLLALALMIGSIAILAACGGSSDDTGPAGNASGIPFEVPADAEQIETESGLTIVVLEEGSGPSPSAGDNVAVHYIGRLDDGTEFDNSYDRGEPIQFPLGQGRVIAGWDEGVALLEQGAEAVLIIPPELGYGERGAGGVIPPNATLYFQVELVSVNP